MAKERTALTPFKAFPFFDTSSNRYDGTLDCVQLAGEKEVNIQEDGRKIIAHTTSGKAHTRWRIASTFDWKAKKTRT